MAEEVSHSRGLRPRALIVTIYGLYAREVGGWLSVGALIRLMADLGVDEPAVRSSISRLKRRGILEAERVDGAAGYALSDQARAILDEGDRRIFERPRATVADGWVLAVFSVPESERQQRHMLRSRLSWLGFGTVAAGVWIAPGHLEAETRDVLERHGLSSYVDLFLASYQGFADVADEIETWWDLDGLQRMYDDFVVSQQVVLDRWRRRRSPDTAEAFADYVRALTEWRRLPFLDPGLAPELLPTDWHGARAADLFADLRGRLAGPAHQHVEGVTAR
ncbi:MAG: PaaX family transcriptional regulator [Propionibacteriales bacterium]|nr:PaaX family transcriptional regulator [Propionibacteriales bacterium]